MMANRMADNKPAISVERIERCIYLIAGKR